MGRQSLPNPNPLDPPILTWTGLWFRHGGFALDYGDQNINSSAIIGVETNTWTFVAASLDGTGQNVVMWDATNGWREATDAGGYNGDHQSGDWASGPFPAGYEENNNRVWNGLLDDPAIYNRNVKMTHAQLRQLIPEPSTIVLLGLGGFFLPRKKRQARAA